MDCDTRFAIWLPWHAVSERCGWPRCLAVTPGGYAELARRCPQLEELRAYACAAVDDAALEALAALPRLRLLDICGAHLVTGMPKCNALHRRRSAVLPYAAAS